MCIIESFFAENKPRSKWRRAIGWDNSFRADRRECKSPGEIIPIPQQDFKLAAAHNALFEVRRKADAGVSEFDLHDHVVDHFAITGEIEIHIFAQAVPRAKLEDMRLLALH